MKTRWTSLLYTALLVTGSFSTAETALAQTATPTLDSEQWTLFMLINNLRTQYGAPPVQVSVILQNAAQWMSTDMATNNYFGHIDSLARPAGARIVAFGYPYSFWGEDIASGYSSAQTTFDQWKNACDPDSSGNCTYAHRQIMVNSSYKVVGLGRAYSSTSTYGWYWTADFGNYVDQTIPYNPGSVPPPTISSLTAIPASINAGQSATLFWTVSGATSTSIDNGVGDVSGVSFKSVSPAQTATYTLTATNAGGSVTSKVTVTVSGGGDTQPPTTPTLLSAVAKGPTQVDLAWTASSDNVGVTGYQVIRSGSVTATIGGAALSYSDTSVLPNTTYSYAVKAYDAAGNYSGNSASIQVTTPAVTVSLPAISSFTGSPSTITAGQTSLLSWSVSGATSVSLDNGIGSVSGVTSKSVSPAQTTTYTLTATNSAGSSTARVTVTVNPAPDTQAPSTPALLSAVAKSQTEVDLLWTAATDNVGVAGYQVTRNGAALTTVSGSVLSFADLGVNASTTYLYLIKAYDAAGNYSGASNSIQATTPAQPATAPVISSFSASPSVVGPGQTTSLAWIVSGASSLALDNGVGSVTNLTSKTVSPAQTTTYTLTASSSGGTVTATVTVTVSGADSQAPSVPVFLSIFDRSATEVALYWMASSDNAGVAGYQITRSGSAPVMAPGNTLSYVDSSAIPNTTYSYFLRAFDAAGNYSAASKTLQVTTPQATSVTTCPGPLTGSFTGCYYNNINLSGAPSLVRTDGLINFNWGAGTPDKSLSANSFSVRWQGSFPFDPGTYTFTASTSDGLRLYVDGNIVLDKWMDQLATTYAAAQTLTQGNHVILLEYYEHTNTSSVSLSWKKN